MSVEVPVETPYNVMFDPAFRGSAPIELNGNPGTAVLFTYDTYLHYCGFDWKEYASQYEKMQALNESGSTAEYIKAQEACKTYYNAHLDDYLLLQESTLPQFYYYQVKEGKPMKHSILLHTIIRPRLFLLAISCVLLLLGGCSQVSPDDTQPDSTGSASTTASQPTADDTTATTQAKLTEPRVIPAEFEKIHSSFSISKANWDLDIYANSGRRYVELFIMSPEKLKPEDVVVEVPIDTPSTIYLHEVDLRDALSKDVTSRHQFAYDTYLTYCGMDWADLAQKYETYQNVLADYQASKDKEKKQLVQDSYDAYENLYKSYYEDYCLLRRSMLPKFYYYQLVIWIEPGVTKDETFHTVTVTVGTDSQTLDIGEVRIHASNNCTSTPNFHEIINEATMGVQNPVPGVCEAYATSTDIQAAKDLTLTGLKFVSDGIEIAEINAKITTQGTSADFIWDGKMPINIPAGGEGIFRLTLKDPRMLQPGFEIRGFMVFEFESGGISY